jgi:hypothetical protein
MNLKLKVTSSIAHIVIGFLGFSMLLSPIGYIYLVNMLLKHKVANIDSYLTQYIALTNIIYGALCAIVGGIVHYYFNNSKNEEETKYNAKGKGGLEDAS